MSDTFRLVTGLPGATFGGCISFPGQPGARRLIEAAERDPEALPRALLASRGLLLLSRMEAIAEEPELLVRLSRVFGPEIEDYRETLTPANMVHEHIPQIFVVSNMPPICYQPPRRPNPPLTADGKLPVRFPHRLNWHTDQSYRRPPPDVSLFFAVIPARRDQGQTLFVDASAAYQALPAQLKYRVADLQGLHVSASAGRTFHAVLAGETPRPLLPHQRPQCQPVVRVHPVTGRRALYLCEFDQMDWLEGPFVGMQPGPHGDGAKLLFALMSHLTSPEFVYVHEWTRGDLLVWDNRCLVHAATWYDAATQTRLMWRTTVSGNPGPAYAGERKSWLPAATPTSV